MACMHTWVISEINHSLKFLQRKQGQKMTAVLMEVVKVLPARNPFKVRKVKGQGEESCRAWRYSFQIFQGHLGQGHG